MTCKFTKQVCLNTVEQWDALGCVSNLKEMSGSFLLLSAFDLTVERQQSHQ